MFLYFFFFFFFFLQNATHVCDVCAKAFIRYQHLVDHQRIHDSEYQERRGRERKRRAEESAASLILKRRQRESEGDSPPPPHGAVRTETAFKSRLSTWLISNDDDELDISTFLESKRGIMVELARRELKRWEIKINCVIRCLYVRNHDGEIQEKMCTFKTKNASITNELQINDILSTFFAKLMKEAEDFQEKDSGWSLNKIIDVEFRINKHNPMRGSTFIDLPEVIKAKKAVINVVNEDQQCFKWAVLSALHPVDRHMHSNRPAAYREFESTLNFDGLEFPITLNDVKIFEKLNNLSVSIYGLSEKHHVFPLQISEHESPRCIELLLLQNQSTSHYCWIKNLSRLASHQYSAAHGKRHICKRCLQFFTGEDVLAKHDRLCHQHKAVAVQMPKDDIIRFKNVQHSIRVPFVCYADFECLTEKMSTCLPNPDASYTSAYQKHRPISFAYHITCEGQSYKEPTVYRGPDAARKFMMKMAEEAKEIQEIYRRNEPMAPLTRRMTEEHTKAQVCYLCDRPFTQEDGKVRDHSHITGIYRGAAHNSCNLANQNPTFLPVLFHNLTGYDSHLFIKEMDFEEGDINIIPNNEEKYISISKKVKNGVEIRFLDSCRFMMASLDTLTKNLEEDQFRYMRGKFHNDDQFNLMLRKGVFPYDYFDSEEKCLDEKLPPKADFFSHLNQCHISDEDYAHAQTVWDAFSIKNLGEYADLYLLSDVLLLTDIFENFRSVCMKTYSLDPTWYFTAPGLSWDAMLKSTQENISLIPDVDMLLFAEEGIRGGISQCSGKYGKANNKYVDEYDPQKESSYLLYLDANNLYGWAMSRPLPLRNFEWCEPSIDVMSILENSTTGYIFEVDLEYPEHLHRHHSDLPLAPENRIPDGYKEKRLLTTLYEKKRYIIHYVNLQQCIRHGLKVTHTHRVLRFEQKAWLKQYIDKNTALRAKATNDFDKNFYKLMNNSVFGKTMENVRNRVDIRLCTEERQMEKLIAKPNFERRVIYGENLVAVHLKRVQITFNKPIIVGMSILDLSKTLMYSYHYDYMKKKYQDISLLYTDTDSFIYHIKTGDVYQDMLEDLDKYDTSDYDQNNPYNIPPANCKKLGLMKDETKGQPIVEFVGLRSKMYAYRTQGDKVTKRLKGIKKATVARDITFDQYKACLFQNENVCASFNLIRSIKHEVYSVRVRKLALCNNDQKRYCKPGETTTLPWGHMDIINP